MITYPKSTGRNFDEILRVIDSLQLTANHKVSTPVNWKQGEDVIIIPAVSDDEARALPRRLEGAQAVPSDRPQPGPLIANSLRTLCARSSRGLEDASGANVRQRAARRGGLAMSPSTRTIVIKICRALVWIVYAGWRSRSSCCSWRSCCNCWAPTRRRASSSSCTGPRRGRWHRSADLRVGGVVRRLRARHLDPVRDHRLLLRRARHRHRARLGHRQAPRGRGSGALRRDARGQAVPRPTRHGIRAPPRRERRRFGDGGADCAAGGHVHRRHRGASTPRGSTRSGARTRPRARDLGDVPTRCRRPHQAAP